MSTEQYQAVDYNRLTQLAGDLPSCSCSNASFIYGCRHTARRMMAILKAPKLNSDPSLCLICIRELGRKPGELVDWPSRCDSCGDWHCYKSTPSDTTGGTK